MVFPVKINASLIGADTLVSACHRKPLQAGPEKCCGSDEAGMKLERAWAYPGSAGKHRALAGFKEFQPAVRTRQGGRAGAWASAKPGQMKLILSDKPVGFRAGSPAELGHYGQTPPGLFLLLFLLDHQN
ncbi:MAG: hypothetical protein EOP86_05715 [Verrucomicrobiaceae bacterium]|nr:MAG: hypothetical protein EOP86_05715 [Verrucomicrobiaceae bacterium]